VETKSSYSISFVCKGSYWFYLLAWIFLLIFYSHL